MCRWWHLRCNTGQTFYWLKTLWLNGSTDFAWPQDRATLPACFARDVAGFRPAAGLAPDAVTFVNVGPAAMCGASWCAGP